jgi:hypothetical protein
MKDPEGGELCVFGQPPGTEVGLMEVSVDTDRDPRAIADWWARVLGVERHDDEHGFSYLEHPPNAPFDHLVFAPVPEPKIVKNRIHLDVTTADLQLLLDAGATVLRSRDHEISWDILADPDGNEFCAFVEAGA